MIILSALLIGVLVSALCGARAADWKSVRMRGESALIILLTASAIASSAGAPSATVGAILKTAWIVCLVGALVVGAANWRHPGMAVMVVGLLLNLVVICANWGMPVAGAKPASLRETRNPAIASTDRVHVPLTPVTRLPLLGDVVTLPVYGRLRALMSPGDVLLLTGLALLVAATSLKAQDARLRLEL